MNWKSKPAKKPGLSFSVIYSFPNGMDCWQTRPIDRRYRLVKIRGKLTKDEMLRIDEALRIVFSLR